MESRLSGKVAIITGCGSGIGRAIAVGYAREGADIVGAGRRVEKLEETAKEVMKLGRKFIAIKCDISKKNDCDAVVHEAIDHFGRVDILVNNASVFPVVNFLEITQEQWDEVMAIDLRGAVFMSQGVLPHMISQKSGRIVMINSSVIRRFPANLAQAHYVVAKMGLLGLTRCLASEFGHLGIRVNGIAPGYTPETEGAIKYIEPLLGVVPGSKREAPSIPVRRYAVPDDYTEAAIFLASRQSDYITGQTISIDGGATMQA